MGKQVKKTGMYLSRISGMYQAKNQFHQEVKTKIEVFDRLVLTDPEAFIRELRGFVAKIHLKHPRAGAMEFNIHRSHEKEDPAFSIGGVIHFNLETISGRWEVSGIKPFIPFERHGADQ